MVTVVVVVVGVVGVVVVAGGGVGTVVDTWVAVENRSAEILVVRTGRCFVALRVQSKRSCLASRGWVQVGDATWAWLLVAACWVLLGLDSLGALHAARKQWR
jgi:hypothetical protein